MAELSLRDRLQPALLDRLIDDERLLTMFEITVPQEQLRLLKVAERDFADILVGQGLRLVGAPAVRATADSRPSLQLTLAAAVGRVTLSQLKGLVLKPPGAPQGVELQSFCEIAARNVLNDTVEAGENKGLAARKLREYVCRDLAALLNSSSLDLSLDLTSYPHVQRSVLNFGMPSLAGKSARAVDPLKTAARIEDTIRCFEPRLSKVRVTPEMGDDGVDTHVLAFRIEAQLWGQPLPQHLVLRTSIDVDSGDVRIADSGMK
jgi:type VI secretion system protein ImpF